MSVCFYKYILASINPCLTHNAVYQNNKVKEAKIQNNGILLNPLHWSITHLLVHCNYLIHPLLSPAASIRGPPWCWRLLSLENFQFSAKASRVTQTTPNPLYSRKTWKNMWCKVKHADEKSHMGAAQIGLRTTVSTILRISVVQEVGNNPSGCRSRWHRGVIGWLLRHVYICICMRLIAWTYTELSFKRWYAYVRICVICCYFKDSGLQSNYSEGNEHAFHACLILFAQRVMCIPH